MRCLGLVLRSTAAWLCALLLVAACSDSVDDRPSPSPFPAAPRGMNAGQSTPTGTGNPATSPGSGTSPGSTTSPMPGSETMGPLPLQPGQNMPVNPGTATEPPSLSRVLVFSRTVGYRHESIGAGLNAVRQLGMQNGFEVDASEEPSVFSDENLAGYDVVVFLSTTGDVLDTTQQGAFERYIQAGGGWVGVHSATDTEYDWAWYGQLIGGNAWFLVHPVIQSVQVDVEEATHPSTAHLAARFPLQDELYNFRANPRSSVEVLLRLDETSYMAGEGAMGSDHPIAWYHEFDGGRAFYTGLGHRTELYTDPLYTQHLLGGLRWAAGFNQ